MRFVILIASCQLEFEDSRRKRNEQIDFCSALSELYVHEVGIICAFLKDPLYLCDRHSRFLCQSLCRRRHDEFHLAHYCQLIICQQIVEQLILRTIRGDLQLTLVRHLGRKPHKLVMSGFHLSFSLLQ